MAITPEVVTLGKHLGGRWVSIVEASIDITVMIGEILYNSTATDRTKSLPMVVSVAGASGKFFSIQHLCAGLLWLNTESTDLILINLAKNAMERGGHSTELAVKPSATWLNWNSMRTKHCHVSGCLYGRLTTLYQVSQHNGNDYSIPVCVHKYPRVIYTGPAIHAYYHNWIFEAIFYHLVHSSGTFIWTFDKLAWVSWFYNSRSSRKINDIPGL